MRLCVRWGYLSAAVGGRWDAPKKQKGRDRNSGFAWVAILDSSSGNIGLRGYILGTRLQIGQRCKSSFGEYLSTLSLLNCGDTPCCSGPPPALYFNVECLEKLVLGVGEGEGEPLVWVLVNRDGSHKGARNIPSCRDQPQWSPYLKTCIPIRRGSLVGIHEICGALEREREMGSTSLYVPSTECTQLPNAAVSLALE